MSGFDAVAWDIDGTLLDSEPLHLKALLTVSQRYGVDLSGEPDERFVGLDLTQVWQELQPLYPASLSASTWMEAILAEYCARTHEIALFDDMVELMRGFARAGLPQGCVSNSERVIVDANIAALGIADIVAFSISRDDVAWGKPDPAPYAEACRRLGVSPGRVLAVEDSEPGARSAEAAGLKVVRLDPLDRQRTVAAIKACADDAPGREERPTASGSSADANRPS